MGMHTWTFKSLDTYNKMTELYERDSLYLHYDYEEQANELFDENEAEEYHNCFRTSKRDSNGEYCSDVITSREECMKWLEENKETVSFIDEKKLEEFWSKYPNGVIDFG